MASSELQVMNYYQNETMAILSVPESKVASIMKKEEFYALCDALSAQYRVFQAHNGKLFMTM